MVEDKDEEKRLKAIKNLDTDCLEYIKNRKGATSEELLEEAINKYQQKRQEKIRAWRAKEIEKEKANYKKANKCFYIILFISVGIAFAGLLSRSFGVSISYLIVVGLLPFGIIYGAFKASISALRIHHLEAEDKRDKDLSA